MKPVAEAHERPDERVLVLAPRGRNAEMIAGALKRSAFSVVVCADLDELCRRMLDPTGAVIQIGRAHV